MWKFNGKSSPLLAYKKCYNSAFLPREISIARSPTIPPNTLSRDQLNQDVRENSSAQGSKRFLFTAFVLLCAPLLFFSTLVLFCSLWWWCGKDEQLYVQMHWGRTNQQILFSLKFINPKYKLLKTPPSRDEKRQSKRAKEGIKRERKDETFRFVWAGLEAHLLYNQQTHGESHSFFGSLRRSLRKYYSCV